jgi:hypothetical protein
MSALIASRAQPDTVARNDSRSIADVMRPASLSVGSVDKDNGIGMRPGAIVVE